MVNSGLDILGAKVTEKQISGQKPAYHLLVRSLSFITLFWGYMYTLFPLLYRGPQCKVWDFWIQLWGQELEGRGYSI